MRPVPAVRTPLGRGGWLRKARDIDHPGTSVKSPQRGGADHSGAMLMSRAMPFLTRRTDFAAERDNGIPCCWQ